MDKLALRNVFRLLTVSLITGVLTLGGYQSVKEKQLPAVWFSHKVVENYNDDFADLKLGIQGQHLIGDVWQQDDFETTETSYAERVLPLSWS